ncbi:MAG TPA: hypothetical protein VNK44_05525 [Candidatus Nitrosotenuis sp.]|nr:hypothetical protein [Candidatus Nitrosotenuis sp.]
MSPIFAVSAIESSFDQYRKELSEMLGKVDVDLAIKTMYLERKLPDVEPRVELDLKIKSGSDMQRLAYKLSSKFGFQSSVHGEHLLLVGRATIDDIHKLSQDQSVEHISGTVSAASY